MSEISTTPIGDTGLKRSGGFLNEEFHPRLRGQKAAQVYREMADNSAVVGAFLMAQETLLRQVEWFAKPSGETERHKAEAEYLNSTMNDMETTWDGFMSEALSMSIFGYAWFELVYKIRRQPESKHDDGRIGLKDLSIRAQESLSRWEFGESGKVLGMWQRRGDDYREVFLPVEKAAHFRPHQRKGNPEGRSQLRSAVRSDFFVKRIEEIEAIGIERELAGLAFITVPERITQANASAEEKAQLANAQKLGRRIRAGEYTSVVFPSDRNEHDMPTGWGLKLLSSGGARAISTDSVVRRHQVNILLSVLAEFLLLGMQAKPGSFALADNQTNIFALALNAMLKSIKDVLNAQVRDRLMTLNNVPLEFWPTFEHGDIEQPELDNMAAYVERLVRVGAMRTGEKTEAFLRDYARMPHEDRPFGEPTSEDRGPDEQDPVSAGE